MWMRTIHHNRKKVPTEGQERHDAKDDFDDEDTFLNLDDVLEGAPGGASHRLKNSFAAARLGFTCC